ncbi:MAG: hypothetical protein QM726_08170 [Chitinophagaceae bacterium]
MRLILSIIITIACLAFVGACSKSSGGLKSVPELKNKWNYVAQYYSIGGPGSWHAVSPVTEWINLLPNGEVNSNLDPFKDATGYELPDSAKIKFLIPSKPDGYLLFQYRFDDDGALILSPLNPMCIEGCAMKFKQ